MATQTRLFNALIRTHHITSRKKVTKVKQAATINNVYVLIRSGGSPGMMYVEGGATEVEKWIEVVQKLRYKDYQLAARPAPILPAVGINYDGLHEVATVKEFAEAMDQRGILDWWRAAMGYIPGQSDRM